MEVSALKHAGAAGIHGRSPLLRLQSDERLIVLVRRGNHHAFEALVARYQARLLAFCRHMLGSREDAEDVLQEVFAAAFNAMIADERAINVRPWLYRIARNRSLNHLRRVQPVGVDSMDIHFSDGGLSTADKVHRREDFRQLVADVGELPETQRTALLLREIDALSYEQIAEAMETTVPSVKSLLVRARVSLAEAAEARLLSCEQVREELGEVAEGLRRTSAPVRRHVRSCERCTLFRKQLRQTNRALAAVLPVGPLLLLKKSLLAHLGATAAAGSGGAAAAGGGGAAASAAMHAGASALCGKAAAGLAAAAIVTAGAVEVRHVAHRSTGADTVARAAVVAPPAPTAAPTPPALDRPVVLASAPQPLVKAPEAEEKAAVATAEPEKPAAEPAAEPETALPGAPVAPAEQHEGDTTVLPTETTGTAGAGAGTVGAGVVPPVAPAASGVVPAVATPVPTPVVTTPEAPPVVTPDPAPVATPDPTPAVTPEPTPVATPEPTPEATPVPHVSEVPVTIAP